jgi:hypothetical protein
VVPILDACPVICDHGDQARVRCSTAGVGSWSLDTGLDFFNRYAGAQLGFYDVTEPDPLL